MSLALRGEPSWEVLRSLPELGWRIRKHFFAIKKHIPNQDDRELLLSWTEYGPDMNVAASQLQTILSVLSTVQVCPKSKPPTFKIIFFIIIFVFIPQAPFAINIELFRCNEIGCLVVRRIIEKGSLRDMICGSKLRTPFLRKYGYPKQIFPFSGRELVLYSHQILQILAILHHKNIPYGKYMCKQCQNFFFF